MVAANVIPIGERERSGTGKRLLTDCQNQLIERLALWLEELRPVIVDELFELADSTSDRIKQTRYFDLRRRIEREWLPVVQTFRAAMTAAGKASARDASVPFDFSALSLVADGDLALRIVIREFAAQLCETCDEELYGIDRRVAALLGETEPVQGEDNPLSPACICQSLSDACQSLAETDEESGIVLLRRLERHLHLVLPEIYRGLNAYLISSNVLSDLKRSYRRTAPSAASAAQTPPTDVLGALQRLALARGGVAPGSASVAPSAPVAGGVFPGGTTAGMLPGAMVAAAGVVPAGEAGLSPSLLVSLNSLQHAVDLPAVATTANLVRQVRDSEAARGVGALEAVTIDIVAMLFDFIFDAKDVPAAVKSLVGRLQIPVLKIAMMDASFFSSREHPARRFLDEISGIAQAWGDGVSENDLFYCKLQALVTRIQQEFETDVSVFDAAIGELEAFVAENEARQEAALAAVTESVARREVAAAALEAAQERARLRAEAAFAAWQARTGSDGLPLLKAFYASYWRQVLERCALDWPGDEVADRTAWQEKIDVMDDLAWSVVPKSGQEERMRLISLLPTLLARLNAGLDTICVAPEVRRQFFDTLVLLHSAALRNQAPPATAAEATPPVTPVAAARPETAGEVVVTRSTANGIEMEDVILASHSPTWCGNDPQMLQRVEALKRGDWVEFIGDDGVGRRERLNWVSPQRGIMVFSNHGAAKAISISPEALAHMLKEGKAVLVARESLFERALENVVSSLNAAA